VSPAADESPAPPPSEATAAHNLTWPPGRESPGQPLSKAEHSHEPPWSPWLRLMLAEITRKREERDQARLEQLRREVEEGAGAQDPSDPGTGI